MGNIPPAYACDSVPEGHARPDTRNEFLDVLRGLAAVMVTLFHLNEPIEASSHWYRSTVKFGWVGVVVFFVVSGFCIHTAAVRSGSAGSYLWRRLTRIYPPYWASVLFVALVCVVRKGLVGVNDRAVWPHDAAGWLATLTAMVAPASSTPGVNWVYWTLAYELAFYGVTLLAVFRNRLFLWVTAALAVVSVMPFRCAACPEQLLQSQWSIHGLAAVPGLFFLSHWPIFGVGAGLSAMLRGDRLSGVLVVLTCVVAVALQFPVPVLLGTIVAACLVGLPKDLRPTRRLEGPLIWLGKVSFSLYLIHVPLGCWLLLHWKKGPWVQDAWLSLTYDLGVTAVCVGAAWLFYCLIEKPSLQWGRMRLSRFVRQRNPGALSPRFPFPTRQPREIAP